MNEGVDRQEAEDIAELKVRQYFDCFEKKVLPSLVRTVVQAHNDDREAHGGVERRLNKTIWLLTGAAVTGGLSGAGLTKLLTLL